MRADLEILEEAVGHRFRSRDILVRALTHTSHAYEQGQQPLNDNEQLEFLGDAVLGFLVSECLVSRYPAYREGRLSIIKNYLVSASHLHEAAQKLELGEYLLLGRGEELSGGRVKKGLLADAVEALIAAIYLDGGVEAVREFVVRHILGTGPEGEENTDAPFTNFKGALQEIARSLNLPSPRYSVVSEHGPAHSRRFTVEVRIGEDLVAQAEGDSKKGAGQKAARVVFEQLMEQAG
ncbi:MAG: ribonuclease III [Bryobacteraceae bacterium]|jgi:ribonuclease-3